MKVKDCQACLDRFSGPTGYLELITDLAVEFEHSTEEANKFVDAESKKFLNRECECANFNKRTDGSIAETAEMPFLNALPPARLKWKIKQK